MIIKPKILNDLKGIDKNIIIVNDFIRSFQDKDIGYKKACLLYGHQGTGKTSLVHCVANEYGFPLIEINGSETRTRETLIEALVSPISTTPFEYAHDHTTKHRIILIDEADGLDKNAIKILPEIFKQTIHPIFLTANDDYPFKYIKNMMTEIKFYRHRPNTISTILRKYTSNEDHILKITKYCDGDIRAALNMLDSCVTKIYSEREIYFVVDSLLNGKLVDGEFDIDNNVLLEWIEENIQYHNLGISFLQDYQNLCSASRLIRKSTDMTRMLLTDNTQLLSTFHINEWIKTMSPSYKEKIRVYKARHLVVKTLSDKLPLHTHTRFESDILPILQKNARNEKWLKDIYHQYLYDNDDKGNPKPEVVDMIALLLNVSKDDIAVRGFFDIVHDKNIERNPVQEAQKREKIIKPMGSMVML